MVLLFLGKWEQALSRKDKKNRKKDDTLANDDAVPENIGNIDFFFFTLFGICFLCIGVQIFTQQKHVPVLINDGFLICIKYLCTYQFSLILVKYSTDFLK